MDVRMREVPEQTVVTEQRMVDQKALEQWLPEAMPRVHKAAGDMAAGTADQPYLLRDHVADEPVFIVIYEGNPNEGETAGRWRWTTGARAVGRPRPKNALRSRRTTRWPWPTWWRWIGNVRTWKVCIGFVLLGW